MERVWITNGSTSVAPVVNAVHAACHQGFVPTHVHVLGNPGIEDVIPDVESMLTAIVDAHDGTGPEIAVTHLDDELDFDGIVSYLRTNIEAAQAAGAAVAVDVTPGRKFWSFISFQAGIDLGVDHLYYVHVTSDTHFGSTFPTIPRPALRLIDFQEEL